MTVKEFINNTNEETYRIKFNGKSYLMTNDEAIKYFGSRMIKNITNNLQITLITIC